MRRTQKNTHARNSVLSDGRVFGVSIDRMTADDDNECCEYDEFTSSVLVHHSSTCGVHTQSHTYLLSEELSSLHCVWV